MLEQSMKDVRRARAVAEDRHAAACGRLLRRRRGKLPTDASGVRGRRRKPGLDQRLATKEIMKTEGEPAAEPLENDVVEAVAWHDCQNRLFERSRDVPSQGRASQRRAADPGDRSNFDVASFLIGRFQKFCTLLYLWT